MKRKWKLWLIPLAAILALGIFKGGFWHKNEMKQEEPVQIVSTQPVSKIKIENILSLTGNIEAFHQAIICAELPAGRVSEVLVNNGDQVTAGQPLVYIKSDSMTHSLAINQASLKKAETGLATAGADYQRYQELYKQGAVSEKEFESMETARKLAEAEVSSATAAVANAEKDLRNTTITSPIGGFVANRNVTTGQMVSLQGPDLMTVEDIAAVYVVVNIDQGELSNLKVGLKTEIAVNAYGNKHFTGEVAVINPVANKDARVFEAKIKVPNPEFMLKPGMFAKVKIKTGEADNALAIPQAALTTKQGMYFVFIPEGDQAKRVPVEVGQIMDQLVEIKQGLKEGQEVVITNANKLKDQDKIKVAR
ncbi:efflux RND transporter periplasmic adaptor subunit [Desulfotomaculum sp. 1211_IL3151]|uniref:efflux RND transporter periplasmic adaptor subunit n=1 Tax=Desulfotomaculum sp. 1211_IL3151 TaxID=3084055 RepID=UPI002FD90415